MKTLEIKIKTLFITRTYKVTVPEAYREMTNQQFHYLCKLNRDEISAEDFIRNFFNIPLVVWQRMEMYYIYILTELVRAIKPHTFGSGFYDESVRILARSFPLPKMPTMSLMQFMSVDTYAQWYDYTKKDDYLAQFASVLLLPHGRDFFDFDPSANCERFKKALSTDEQAKTTLKNLHFNWMLIKSYLADKHPNMFPPGEGEGEGKSVPGNWSDVFDALVGERLEHIEDYKRLAAYDVIRVIDSRIRENKFKK